jgi:hypothetical protein
MPYVCSMTDLRKVGIFGAVTGASLAQLSREGVKRRRWQLAQFRLRVSAAGTCCKEGHRELGDVDARRLNRFRRRVTDSTADHLTFAFLLRILAFAWRTKAQAERGIPCFH